jgi:acyl-CoA thioester hydrolase
VGTQVFRHEHRVTYREITVGNHVYYARYLDLLEAARGEFSRALGFPVVKLQEQDMIFPVVECRVRYKAPARYDDVLVIEVWVTTIDRVRLGFGYRIVEKQSQRLILEGESLHVCTGVNEKPKRLPDELAAALKPFQRVTAPLAMEGTTP